MLKRFLTWLDAKYFNNIFADGVFTMIYPPDEED